MRREQRSWIAKWQSPILTRRSLTHSGYRWNEYADALATAWMRDEV